MNESLLLLGPLITVLRIIIAAATFSPAFQRFLQDEYGKDIEEMISRTDIGADGSFGGGNHTAGLQTLFVYNIYFKFIN